MARQANREENTSHAEVQNTSTDSIKKEPTYLELISRDEKEVKQSNTRLIAQRAALATSEAFLKVQGDLSQAQRDYENSKAAQPYCVEAEYKAFVKVTKLASKVQYINEVLTTRFTDANIMG